MQRYLGNIYVNRRGYDRSYSCISWEEYAAMNLHKENLESCEGNILTLSLPFLLSKANVKMIEIV